uniref:lipopolysaccharide biosynthesis protein n=1 Tax=Altererythrobacter segetis TaxID=1104773 RepID=UPI00140A8B6B|nr:oligosaccharide flippase family protein [Altererythrobacter segetis]
MRDITIYVAARAFPAALTLASLALLTRYLSPADFGRYSLAISLAGFVNVVLMSWNLQAFYRFHPIYRGRRAALLRNATVAGFLISAAIGVLVVMPLIPLFARDWGWGYALATVALTPGLAGLELMSYRLNTAAKPVGYFALQLARTVGNLVAGGLVAYLTNSLVLVLLSIAGWWSLTALFAGLGSWIARLEVAAEHRRMIRQMLAYGLPLTAASALISAVGTLDRFMLEALTNSRTVGEFAAGMDLVQFCLGAMGSAISLAAYPGLMAAFSRDGEELKPRLERYSSVQIAVILPLAVGFALAAEPLSKVFVGQGLQPQAAAVIPWASAAIFLGVLKGFYLDLSFQLARWTVGSTLVAGIMVVIVAVLNFLLIPLRGSVGTAQASLGGFAVAAVLSYVLGSRHAVVMPFCVPDLVKLAIAGAAMALAMASVTASSPLPALLVKGLAGGVAYVVILIATDPFEVRKTARVIFSRAAAAGRDA